MCQCGCGDTNIERAVGLGRGVVMGVQTYDGCRDCFQGIAVDLLFFNNRKSEWLDRAKIQDIKPDEFGGDKGNGLPIPLLDVGSLRSAAKEIDMKKSLKEYGGNIDAWLHDEGLNWLQAARRIFDKKHAAQVAEIEARMKP